MRKKRKRWCAVAKRVKAGAIGAEVGVYKGTMSKELFKRIKGLTLYMIDRWQPYTEEEQAASPKTRIARIKDKKKWRRIRLQAKSAVKKYHRRAKIIRADSIKAASRIKDSSLDFVFIDGDHSYQGVKRDIAAWTPKLKPGGWLMGHDYGNKPDGGVRKAVDEMGLKIEHDCDHVWAVRIDEKKEEPVLETGIMVDPAEPLLPDLEVDHGD